MIDQIISQGGLTAWALTLAIALCVAAIVAAVLTSSFVRLELSEENKIWSIIVGLAFLCSLATAPLMSSRSWSEALLFYALPPLGALFYFLPTAAAMTWHSPAFKTIFRLNLFLGWTGIGWIVAFVWAARQTGENASAPPGGMASPTVPPTSGKPE